MRMSRYLVPTLKETPSDAVVVSHRLMLRAGLIRKEAAGMYAYLPLGLRVLQKITGIVRYEMNRAGALEFLMPELTFADLWKESGRWDTMGPEMFRIKDRNNMEYALAPTHEEAFTSVVRSIISSYKDLPLNVYQVNTKFRDEIRPRFGVIRSKEFIMKDAYSFDMDEKGLEESYQAMRVAYRNVFNRCGLETIPVEADTGAMGGSDSEEFMVASEVGEELLLICKSCGYRANQERAGFKAADIADDQQPEDMKPVNTPDVKTIDDLVQFFDIDAHKFMKSIIYVADEKPVMVVVPGDRDINDVKLKNFLGAVELDLAPDGVVEDVTGAPVGFAGPVEIKNIRIVYDREIKNIRNGITGANKLDTHYSGVNPGRDFTVEEEGDFTLAVEGDACPHCGKPMITRKGIEVGHIFKLGYKYTKSMDLTVLDQNGKAVHPIMGCYGIGVNRTMAAVVEQHNDDRGIIWPITVAPFHVEVVGLAKSEEETASADEIYQLIRDAGMEVLYDDRKASPGFKFGDADLIGIPLRVTVGKSFFAEGQVEVKLRATGEMVKMPKEELLEYLQKQVSDLFAELSP
ncbi:MAG: proline--tRNA ligase [Spirochaetota bacterium]